MKLKKTILGWAVVAVAGVNAWLANDASARNNVLSLLNLENVADASECVNSEPSTGGHWKTETCDGYGPTLCRIWWQGNGGYVACAGRYSAVEV